MSRASQASSSGWLGGFAECIWSSGMTSPWPKSRCQTRLTIARAKNSRSPGCERHLHQLGPALNFGAGGGTFSFLARSSASFSFFCSSLDGSFASALVDLPAGQEHHPGLAFDVLGRLEPDRAVAALAQKAWLAVPLTNVRLRNDFIP